MRPRLLTVDLLVSAFVLSSLAPPLAAAPGCNPPPVSPSLYAEGDSTTGDRVLLAWDPVPGAIVQQIIADGQQIASVSGDASTYLDTTATACVERTYIVRTLHYPCGTLDSDPVSVTPVAISTTHRTGDFNGDGKTDPSVYEQSTGLWTWFDDSTSTAPSVVFGSPGDRPAPADYDGDGISDLAVYKASTSTWWIQMSCGGALRFAYWGLPSDWLVPADYDGDGKADVTIYRPGSGQWWTQFADGSQASSTNGGTEYVPVPGDYDGDRRTDRAVYRASDHTWRLQYSSSNNTVTYHFGQQGDVPTPVERNGRTEIAVWRGGTGLLIMQRSGGLGCPPMEAHCIDHLASDLNLGLPAPGDYDGDGEEEVAINHNGDWLNLDASQLTSQKVGSSSALSIPLLRLGTPP